MTPTERDHMLDLFRHAAGVPAATGAHVADDDELLAAWRMGDLSPAEEDRFYDHLEMVEPGIVPLPDWHGPGSEYTIPCYAGMGR